MYAIAEIKGKQYKIEKGDNVLVEYLGVDDNTAPAPEIKVMLVKKDDGSIVVGAPYVDGVSVTSKVVEHLKGDKVLVGKHKKRKDYRRKVGHRQKYHVITIEDIKA